MNSVPYLRMTNRGKSFRHVYFVKYIWSGNLRLIDAWFKKQQKLLPDDCVKHETGSKNYNFSVLRNPLRIKMYISNIPSIVKKTALQ